MKINELSGFKIVKAKRRKGRGIAAGGGKTAGRGTKGQNSRSGGGVRPHFEGGQTALIRRMPKLAGFTSHRPQATVIYTGQLDSIKTNSKTIDNYVLVQAGLIKEAYLKVKLIKSGEVKTAHTLRLQVASKAAVEAVVAAGGEFEKTNRPKRPVSTKKQGRSESRNNPKDDKKSAVSAADVVK